MIKKLDINSKFDFGKFKHHSVIEILHKHFKYINWLVREGIIELDNTIKNKKGGTLKSLYQNYEIDNLIYEINDQGADLEEDNEQRHCYDAENYGDR